MLPTIVSRAQVSGSEMRSAQAEPKAPSTIASNHTMRAIAPGVAILLTALAFNLLGDGLRDVLDPRLVR